MSVESEHWVKNDAKQLRIVSLRNQFAANLDRREITVFSVPGGEQGHRQLGCRERETMFGGLVRKFSSCHRETLGDG